MRRRNVVIAAAILIVMGVLAFAALSSLDMVRDAIELQQQLSESSQTVQAIYANATATRANRLATSRAATAHQRATDAHTPTMATAQAGG
jgi:hypothetical protein